MNNQDWKKNKTYEEIYGEEKAKRIRKKMSITRKGHIVSIETRKKIGLGNSISLKNNKYPNKGKFKKGQIPWNKDKKTGKQSKNTIKKRSNSIKNWHKKNKGTIKYKERSRKISISQLGDNNNSKSPQAREKNRQAHLGEKSSLWNGGVSFEPYSVDWTKTLKRAIRERDRYICQICFNDGYPVHHIDYDKKNCNMTNLICLCESCHGKTNVNREKWKKLLQQKMILK